MLEYIYPRYIMLPVFKNEAEIPVVYASHRLPNFPSLNLNPVWPRHSYYIGLTCKAFISLPIVSSSFWSQAHQECLITAVAVDGPSAHRHVMSEASDVTPSRCLCFKETKFY